jgi:hypothetical protein
MAHGNTGAPTTLLTGQKLNENQVRKMFALWLLMSANCPCDPTEMPTSDAVWQKVAPHVTDLPGIQDNFKTLYESNQLALRQASGVFRDLYNSLNAEQWGGSGDCFFKSSNILALFP